MELQATALHLLPKAFYSGRSPGKPLAFFKVSSTDRLLHADGGADPRRVGHTAYNSQTLEPLQITEGTFIGVKNELLQGIYWSAELQFSFSKQVD